MSRTQETQNADAPPLTVAERIEKGRESGHHYDGAIVPFPPELSARGAMNALKDGERKRVDRWLAAGYQVTAFSYRSSAGELIQAVLRFDHPSERKEIRQLRYCGRFDGKGPVFWMTAVEAPRPLYGLDLLAKRPNDPVLVVEGEKTADAAGALFPDHVAVTWMNGASGVRKTEMLDLAGRDLVLWPDNDPPGRNAMRTFAAYAYAAGAASVKIVDVPPEFGEKWDLADPVPEGLSDSELIQALLASARRIDPSSVAHITNDAREEAEQHRLLGYKPGYTKVEIAHAAVALSVLDADMYAAEWRRIARCLFYAYGEAGLAVFDEWSQDSEGKYRTGEPAKLWAGYAHEKAFRADSLAWLFRKAAAVVRERSKNGVGSIPNVEIGQAAIATASVEELNEDHAIVVRGGKVGVLWESFDPRFGRYTETYLSKRDFVDRFVRSIELPHDDERQTKKKDKRMSQGDLWFSSPRRRSYDNVIFAPGQSLSSEFLNLWRGFAVEPVDNPDGWRLLKEHLRLHVAGGDEAGYQYILNWLAFAVQHLDKPIGTALVLLGKKGAGKSIIIELFGYLFGQHTFVTSRMDDAIGRFNDRLETTVLLGLEEAIAPQNRAADGTLKDLVTRTTLRLEGKFFGVWTAPNHLRIIVTSNNEHVVRADGSERRYAVFEVTNPHQADPNARRAYFGRMVEQMETGGYAAMLGELLSRDIRGWNAEVIPETEALKRQKLLNLVNDPVRAYLYERLTEGVQITTGTASLGSPVHHWSETDTVNVPARDLSEDFRLFATSQGMAFSERQLAMQLPKYMPSGFKSTTKRVSNGDYSSSTVRVYPFPALEIARARFEEVTGLLIARDG
ncbi:DUF5906 domain-containing protein [Sphingomonadaceae bacterium OTU29LAMAA1]|nr:DUF5906 domain-containing protein [Sphingomonadaceae bacterium OTU29LAMAA1]